MERKEIESKVSEIIVNILGVTHEQVKQEASFENDLGGDSLDMVEVCMESEKEFDITIPEDSAYNCNTVKEFCDLVENLKNSPS